MFVNFTKQFILVEMDFNMKCRGLIGVVFKALFTVSPLCRVKDNHSVAAFYKLR